MPEINLLQGNVCSVSTGSGTRTVLNVVGGLALLAVVACSGLFYFQLKQAKADDASTVASQASVDQSISGDANYKNFITSQAALSAATSLFASHVGWISLIPNFSSATLKTASFSSFQATVDGGVNVTGTVPTFNDLDKMMQGFQLQSFSSLISSVSLQSVGLDHSSTGNSIAFTIHVQLAPSTLKYQNQ